MKIGLFDHIEDGARPLTTLFDERLQFAAAADAAGFYCLHLAEHHATPLNMVPVPGIFMGALARATKRMRMGPLVYLLPLYSPLRLIEEISMLDHLSYGRLDVGVGRGVSPYELKYHKVEHDDSRDIFIDAFKCLSAGLVTDSLSYKGDHYVYENVPIALSAAAAAAPAVLVRVLERNRLDLGRRTRPAFRHFGADGDRQNQHRRLQEGAGQTRRTGAAQGGVSRWRGDRRATAYFRRRYGRGSASLRQAGHGGASR